MAKRSLEADSSENKSSKKIKSSNSISNKSDIAISKVVHTSPIPTDKAGLKNEQKKLKKDKKEKKVKKIEQNLTKDEKRELKEKRKEARELARNGGVLPPSTPEVKKEEKHKGDKLKRQEARAKAGISEEEHLAKKESKKIKKDKKKEKNKKDKTNKTSNGLTPTAPSTKETSQPEQSTQSEPLSTTGPDSDAPATSKHRFIVFIGNLPYTASTSSVAAHFKSVSPSSIRCPTQADGTTGKGYAFVEFERYDRMQACIAQMHHTRFDDGRGGARRINVELTAGGGGNGEARKQKLRTKNERLQVERKKAFEKGGEKRKVVENGEEEMEAEQKQDESQIHPSRRARIDALGY